MKKTQVYGIPASWCDAPRVESQVNFCNQECQLEEISSQWKLNEKQMASDMRCLDLPVSVQILTLFHQRSSHPFRPSFYCVTTRFPHAGYLGTISLVEIIFSRSHQTIWYVYHCLLFLCFFSQVWTRSMELWNIRLEPKSMNTGELNVKYGQMARLRVHKICLLPLRYDRQGFNARHLLGHLTWKSPPSWWY